MFSRIFVKSLVTKIRQTLCFHEFFLENMPFRKKWQILVVVAVCLVILYHVNRRRHETSQTNDAIASEETTTMNKVGHQHEKHSHIKCKINHEVGQNIGLAPPTPRTVDCLADSKNQVYVPFTFIKKYFDV